MYGCMGGPRGPRTPGATCMVVCMGLKGRRPEGPRSVSGCL